MKNLLKTALRDIKKALSATLPTVLMVFGAAAVSIGVGMIYSPAGVIAAGGLAITGGVLLILGRSDGDG